MLRQSEPWRPSDEDLRRVDSTAARVRPDSPALVEWFEGYRRQHRARLAADLRMIRQRVEPGARILECGAVPLLATGALAGLGYEVSAVDVAPERFSAAISELGLDVRGCNVETEPLPFESASFDAVVFNELFEHLRINPIATLGEVRRVLVPAGLLFLSTPNLRSFRGIRNLLLRHRASTGSAGVYAQYEKLETLGHMGHVREYTAREVAGFLERVGFRVDTVVYRGGHGRGLVGLAERLAPSMRPFIALIAAKESGGA